MLSLFTLEVYACLSIFWIPGLLFVGVLQPRERFIYVVGHVGCLSWYFLLVIEVFEMGILSIISNVGCAVDPCYQSDIFDSNDSFPLFLQQVSSFGLFLLVSWLFYGLLLLVFLVHFTLRILKFFCNCEICSSLFLLLFSATILHASFRTPNLKARLNTFREEFRAVWRNYSEL